jgi:uncharacterized membrane protein YdjX (TVP38/TMEM64 family)
MQRIIVISVICQVTANIITTGLLFIFAKFLIRKKRNKVNEILSSIKEIAAKENKIIQILTDNKEQNK